MASCVTTPLCRIAIAPMIAKVYSLVDIGACESDVENFGGAMKKFTAHLALSRRSAIKGAAAVAAGAAAPALLRIRSAYAAYPDRAVKILVANGGPSDLVGRMITAALQQSTGKT